MGEMKRACIGHNTMVTKEYSVHDHKGDNALVIFGKITVKYGKVL